MARRVVHPYGQSIPITRAFSLLFALAVVAMLYERMRDPNMWRWLTGEGAAVVNAEAAPSQQAPQPPEIVVPGPNDLDPEAVAELGELLKVVRDKEKLLPREMPAYWRLMAWSRSQSFAEMEQRAIKDVPFVKVWEQPEEYQGKLVRMRMHVRRVMQWRAPKNPLGVKETFEVFAWTDDSLSFPYVVVIPDLPAGLPVGVDVSAEIVFVGYFLKNMQYEAFDKTRGMPLFLGRARVVSVPAAAKGGAPNLDVFLAVLAIGGLMIGGLAWLALSRRSRPTLAQTGLPPMNEGAPFWSQPADDAASEESARSDIDFTGQRGS